MSYGDDEKGELRAEPAHGLRMIEPPRPTGEHPVMPLWDVADVMRLTRMSETWVKRHTADGTIPSMKLGGSRRYDPTDVVAWLEQRKRKGC